MYMYNPSPPEKTGKYVGIPMDTTVDGRNPAPLGMYKTLKIMGC